MSCAGNDDLHTPNMDRLAADGVRFENTYCANPLCTPSRAAMMTGRMPTETGVEFGDPIPEEYRDRELGTLFDDAGYDCGYGGKWHVGDLSMPADNDHGFERVAGFDDTELAGAAREFIARDREVPFHLQIHFDNPNNICEYSRDQPLPWGGIEEVPTEECPTLPANHAPPPYEPKVIRDTLDERPTGLGAMEGATDGGRVDPHVVSSGLDLLPTLCDYADIDPPADLRGRSVRPLAAGEPVDDWHDYVVTQGRSPEGRMVRTPQYKYVVYQRGRDREQLFDLEADPGEMVDLSVDADHADVLDEHRELLLEWCLETGDTFATHYAHGEEIPTIPGYEYDEVADAVESSE